MLELVSRHLRSIEKPRLEVIEASDGDEAWRLAQERLPDLVVLDVMMPGMSGWEVCRKIREDVALAHTGVVMLTGIGENLNQMTSPLYGADAYIDKPFEFGELDEKVKSALQARASQRDGVTRPTVNGVGGPARDVAPPKAKPVAKAKPAATEFTFYDTETPLTLALTGGTIDVVGQFSVAGRFFRIVRFGIDALQGAAAKCCFSEAPRARM